MIDPDTDRGGVKDGVEDVNKDGKVDTTERNPNLGSDDSMMMADADMDGLSDAEALREAEASCGPALTDER